MLAGGAGGATQEAKECILSKSNDCLPWFELLQLMVPNDLHVKQSSNSCRDAISHLRHCPLATQSCHASKQLLRCNMVQHHLQCIPNCSVCTAAKASAVSSTGNVALTGNKSPVHRANCRLACTTSKHGLGANTQPCRDGTMLLALWAGSQT